MQSYACNISERNREMFFSTKALYLRSIKTDVQLQQLLLFIINWALFS